MASGTCIKQEPLDEDDYDTAEQGGHASTPTVTCKLEPPDEVSDEAGFGEGSDGEITWKSSEDDSDGDDDCEGDDFDSYDDDDDSDYCYLDGYDDTDDNSDVGDARPHKRTCRAPPVTSGTSGPRLYKAASGHTWTSEVPTQETPQVKVEMEQAGPRNVNPASTKLELLRLFLPTTELRKILRHTNEELKRKCQKYEINMTELMTVLGLLYYLGLTKSSHENAKTFWKDGLLGRPLCQAAMMGKRFQGILSALRFDDRATREQRKSVDSFAPIREVFETFASACQSFFCPGDNVTVGEQILPFRGLYYFKQYLSKSSRKRGVKFWLSVDSRCNFVTNIQPGLFEEGPKPGKEVVKDLVEPIRGTGRNVTTKTAFTSRKLAEELLADKLTLIGAISGSRPEVPKELKPPSTKKWEVKSAVFAFDGSLTLLSYIPKENHNLLLLSTKHHNGNFNAASTKPEMLDCYHRTKFAVDTVDHLCNFYSAVRRTKRWPVLVFYNLMNLAANNACVLWCALNPDWKRGLNASVRRQAFLADLVTELLHPQLQARAANPAGLHRNARLALASMGYEICYQRRSLPGEAGSENKQQMGRCHLCPRKKGKRTTMVCHTCRHFACGVHSQKSTTITCSYCLN